MERHPAVQSRRSEGHGGGDATRARDVQPAGWAQHGGPRGHPGEAEP